MFSWLLAVLLLGFATGLRSMTPMAVLCWFAYLGELAVAGTWAGWTGHVGVAILFTVLAVGEFVADKLPQTPNRTAAGPLGARVVLGGLAGAIVATALHAGLVTGVVVGGVSAVVGAFTGFVLRRDVVERFEAADWPIAVVEDVSAVLIAVLALHVAAG